MCEIELKGQSIVLLPERAMYWREESTLLIADPHFGKGDTFRRAGIPVPHAAALADLDRLSSALASTGAERLVVLGDFFHARPSEGDATLASLSAWRSEHTTLEVTVVAGNHDRHAGPPPDELGFIDGGDSLDAKPFCLKHFPGEADGVYTLTGHLHPGARVGGSRLGKTLPCFHFGARCAVLPAFGVFTGFARVRPTAGDRVYVIGDGDVFALPARDTAAR